MTRVPRWPEWVPVGSRHVGGNLWTRFSDGVQLAVIHTLKPSGAVYVRKWRRASRRWTQPVRIHPGDIAPPPPAPKGISIMREAGRWLA